MGNCKKTIDLGNIVITIEDVRPSVNHSCGCSVPQHRVAPIEPKGGEGIMVAVQKPQREFYDCGWRGEKTYREHLRKYGNLETAARACDWPNDLVDSGAIQWPVPQKGVVVREPQRQTVAPRHYSSVCTCGSHSNWPTRDLRVEGGLVPVGSVVVDHTWSGEPIFRVNR